MANQQSRSEKNSQDQRVRRTYRELIQALERLLCEMPLEQMTVKQICQAAGIQRTTFYQHFHDMPDFLDWYIAQKQEEFRALTPSRISADEAGGVYLEMAQAIMRYIHKNEKLVKALMHTQINGTPLFDLYVSTCVNDLTKNLENAAAVEKRARNTPVPFLAEFYAGGMISAFRWWIVNNKPVTEEEFMNYLRLRVKRTAEE